MISTIETFHPWFNPEQANCSKLWGPGICHQVILDEADRIRTGENPISKFRKANGKLVKIDFRDYINFMTSCILNLELQYRLMSTATLSVNGVDDLCWIPHLLETSFCSTLHLPPDRVYYTLNINDNGIADGSTVPATECGVEFTPVADPYKKHT